MARDSTGAMVSRLQGLLLLTALSSAMLEDLSVDNQSSWSPWEPLDQELSGGGPFPPMDNLRPFARGGPLPGGPLPDGPFEGGDPDMAFCDMLLNAPVPPPIEQVPWFCVCSRCKSNTGPKGGKGDRGLTGRPGSRGRRGLTGFRGLPGFRGRPGLKGQKGSEGDKGDQGLRGFRGAKGARGYKGDKGDHGQDGSQGVTGPQGESGMCPASCDSVEGRPGEPGIPGMVGARGLPGPQGLKGAKGVKGDLGDLGAPGVPGMDGVKGHQGDQGICNCTDGSDGVDGNPGHLGPKGDKGDGGLEGPQGLGGDKGGYGEMGMMGPPGPCSPAIQSAFSAGLTVPYPMPNMPVPFPRVLTNQQMDFDPVGGIYTAPVNGTYVFSYHLAVLGKILKVGLFHNYVPIVKTTEATNKASTGHQVVLHLNMLDRVWLQVKDETSNGMYTDRERSSTFSGFLVHPDSCLPPLGRGFNDYEVQPTKSYSWEVSTTPAPTVSQSVS